MATKTDMERVGIFMELGYHTVGDPYHAPSAVQFNNAATKGKQMLPGGSKIRSGNSAGYFSDFSRVFDGEAYSDPIKIRRQHRVQAAKSNLGKPWLHSSNPKLMSGVGSYLGTFSGSIDHFSAINKASKSAGSDPAISKKNVMTSPLKKGSGYGYMNVTLSKYPEYKPENYNRVSDLRKKEIEEHKDKIKGKGTFFLNMHPKSYFDANPFRGNDKPTYSAGKSDKRAGGGADLKPFKPSSPAKKDGGMKAGCLNPFPEYPSNKYLDKLANARPVQVVNNSGKIYYPNAGPKGMPSNSVLYQNIAKTVTPLNYTTATSVMSY